MSVIALGQLILSPVTIPISTTTSGVITTNGMSLVGIYMPATFTGTSITFTACATLGGTYSPMNNKSGPVSYTVAANEYIAIDPTDFYGVEFFKIVSGSTEGAARVLNCSMKGI